MLFIILLFSGWNSSWNILWHNLFKKKQSVIHFRWAICFVSHVCLFGVALGFFIECNKDNSYQLICGIIKGLPPEWDLAAWQRALSSVQAHHRHEARSSGPSYFACYDLISRVMLDGDISLLQASCRIWLSNGSSPSHGSSHAQLWFVPTFTLTDKVSSSKVHFQPHVAQKL